MSHFLPLSLRDTDNDIRDSGIVLCYLYSQCSSAPLFLLSQSYCSLSLAMYDSGGGNRKVSGPIRRQHQVQVSHVTNDLPCTGQKGPAQPSPEPSLHVDTLQQFCDIEAVGCDEGLQWSTQQQHQWPTRNLQSIIFISTNATSKIHILWYSFLL